MGALDGGDETGYTDSELPAAMKKGSYDQEQQTGDAASGGHSSSSVKSFLKKTIWHGGSVYDAWLNAVAAQVSPWKQSTTTTTTTTTPVLGKKEKEKLDPSSEIFSLHSLDYSSSYLFPELNPDPPITAIRTCTSSSTICLRIHQSKKELSQENYIRIISE
jgi:hypothetical protein